MVIIKKYVDSNLDYEEVLVAVVDVDMIWIMLLHTCTHAHIIFPAQHIMSCDIVGRSTIFLVD